ncbi:MAG: hypothetical protein GY913_08850 [Proteobacteria bacterium]|nr:hypothetical protein [Pseudomonadota bacterium]MCP4917019.1 hypothetical protein [Pseudomonadota bacterium]
MLAVLGPWRRFAPLAVVPALAAVGCAVGFAWAPVDPAASPNVLTLVLWLVLGLLARAANVWLPRQAGVAAVVGGLLLGDLATALLLGPRCKDGETAIRVALVASGAAIVSPIGTPATLILGTSPALVALAVPLVLVAWPRGELDGGGNKTALGVLTGLVGLMLFLPADTTPWVLLGGCVPLLGMGLRSLRTTPVPWGPLAWVLGAAVLLTSVDHAGTLNEAAIGIEWLFGIAPAATRYGLFGVAALSAAVAGEGAGSLAAADLLSTFLELGPAPRAALVAGLGIGGLGPVLLARGDHAWKPLWRPWLLQLGAGVIWVAVFG